jgi:hypothetical protein
MSTQQAIETALRLGRLRSRGLTKLAEPQLAGVLEELTRLWQVLASVNRAQPAMRRSPLKECPWLVPVTARGGKSHPGGRRFESG